MKKQIDLPQINWILNFIENWKDERESKRKLREMAKDHTPIAEQCWHMIRWPSDDLEKEIAKAIKG